MADRKESPNEEEAENSVPLPFKMGVDESSLLGSAGKGEQAGELDWALLRPFVHLGKLETRFSEAEIFQKAIAEGTAYLLYQKIKEAADPDLQSRWLFVRLQQSYYLNLAQNIIRVEHFFENYPTITKGFQTILLKGISLFGTVYQDPGLRHLGDIDLLIRKEDYPEVRKSLESADYVFDDDLQMLVDPRNLNSIMCHKKSPGPPQPILHIHWHLINTTLPFHLCNPQIDLDAIWTQSEALPSHSNMRVMSPIHQIIYYAFHHFKHSFDRLIRLHDLDLTIRYYERSFHWPEVLDETRRFNLTRTLYYPLLVARQMLSTPIPESIIEGLRPRKLTFLERRMLQCLLRGGKPIYGHLTVYLALQKGPHNKLRFLYRCFFPSLAGRRRDAFWHLAKRSGRGLKGIVRLLVCLLRR